VIYDASSSCPDQSLEEAVTMAAHHDEVGAQLLGDVDDDLTGVPYAAEALTPHNRRVGRVEGLDQRRELLGSLSEQIRSELFTGEDPDVRGHIGRDMDSPAQMERGPGSGGEIGRLA
jgi:hypothetical protein